MYIRYVYRDNTFILWLDADARSLSMNMNQFHILQFGFHSVLC